MTSLTKYLLHLADSNLIHAQRLSEWCAHGPILEQDIAITNISLDLIGQSRNFYQYAASQINSSKNNTMHLTPSSSESAGDQAADEVNEDSLAYLRTEREFKNFLLAELPNGDWAQTITKLFFYSVYQYLLYGQLQKDKDQQLAAIAAKSLKEVTYHVRWSSEWVLRLGDGTGESYDRMVKAIDFLWMYTGELFEQPDFEKEFNIDKPLLKTEWDKKIEEIFHEATLEMPKEGFMQTGGTAGRHTEHLGFLLTELQYLQRTYPGAAW